MKLTEIEPVPHRIMRDVSTMAIHKLNRDDASSYLETGVLAFSDTWPSGEVRPMNQLVWFDRECSQHKEQSVNPAPIQSLRLSL